MSWFGVRTVVRSETMGVYEERVTIWSAESHEDAVRLAEQEARAYATDTGCEYVNLAQSFEMFGDGVTSGSEVFSLMRDSTEAPDAYIARYFATGAEHERPSP